jgi:DNA-directed RNA polymerase subunit beta'
LAVPVSHPIAPRRTKKAWEVEERAALLQQENANLASELQAMEDSTAAATHQGDDA